MSAWGDLREKHPLGSIRYCGDPARGEDHCKCEVIGFNARGTKVALRRLTSGVVHHNYGSVFATMEELERHRGRKRR